MFYNGFMFFICKIIFETKPVYYASLNVRMSTYNPTFINAKGDAFNWASGGLYKNLPIYGKRYDICIGDCLIKKVPILKYMTLN